MFFILRDERGRCRLSGVARQYYREGLASLRRKDGEYTVDQLIEGTGLLSLLRDEVPEERHEQEIPREDVLRYLNEEAVRHNTGYEGVAEDIRHIDKQSALALAELFHHYSNHTDDPDLAYNAEVLSTCLLAT